MSSCAGNYSSAPTTQPDITQENPPIEESAPDPLDNISVLSVACEEWPGHAQVLIENKNQDMYGVSVTIAFVHADGTVAATQTEYPDLVGEATTRLIVERPDEISFSTCKLADLALLQPMD